MKKPWILLMLALLAVAATSNWARAQTRRATNWEYKTIFREHQILDSGQWSDWRSTEDDQSTPMAGTLFQQLNRLGSQGWELIGSSDLSGDLRNGNGNNGG